MLAVAAAAAAVVMLGLALHAVRAVLHGRCRAGRDTFVGYLCLPVARRRMHWRLTRLAPRPELAL